MRKLALAVVLVFALAGYAFAANPFVDVPLNHWAYDAVQSLAAKGIIVGYPDGTFGGNRALTRYEFAMAIARAVGYLEQKIDEAGYATQEDLATLEKLVQEFADELKQLGVTVDDLKKALGEQSAAVKALEDRVAALEKYAEPVKVTGEFDVTYTAYAPTASGKTDAKLSDETTLNIVATINDYTTAGVELKITDTLNTPSVSADNFFIDYKKDEWYIRVGDIDQPKVDLGLVLGGYQPDDDDDDLSYEGIYAVYAPEDSDVTWKMYADVNEFYSLRLEWEKVALGVTWMPEGASLYNAGSDLIVSASGWTDFDESDVKLTLEGAYGVLSGSYGVAGEVDIKASEDIDVTIDGHYVTAGFTPATSTASPSSFNADEMGFGVAATFDLSAEDSAEKWTLDLEYDYAQAISSGAVTTNKVSGTVTYIPDEGTEEKGVVKVTYDLLTAGITLYGAYLNYPLDLDSENNAAYFSVGAEYNMATQGITAVGQFKYQWLEEGTTATLEARYDSTPASGVPPYSVLAQLDWDMAENTTLTLSYELNTFEAGDDFGQGDIIDGAGTITAELTVSF
ncbi:MAG: S-layer homology domain-containing protein [Candidatus Caldatribacterium sp.]|nr:S-layer homology domain-containing protein [Candidatus Caldatribacterium sp.]